MNYASSLQRGVRVRRMLVFGALLFAASLPSGAWAWGPGMHSFISEKALSAMRSAGQWRGLEVKPFVAASHAPDLWWEAKDGSFPNGMAQDLAFPLSLIEASSTLTQLSFAMGYASHLFADSPGHSIYLAPQGSGGGHPTRDYLVAATLFGSFEGYPQHVADLDRLLGGHLDLKKGVGDQPGTWGWSGFDEQAVDLLHRAATAYVRTGAGQGTIPTRETIRAARDALRQRINKMGSQMGMCAYYAFKSRAAEGARALKALDDQDHGAGNGPAVLSRAVAKSISEVVKGLTEGQMIAGALARSGLSAADKELARKGRSPGELAPEAASESTPGWESVADGGAGKDGSESRGEEQDAALADTPGAGGCSCRQRGESPGDRLLLGLLVIAVMAPLRGRSLRRRR